MSSCGQWKPFAVMVIVNFAFSIVNILVKKIIDGGINHMVFVTYRLILATVFLAPIAYYWERKNRPTATILILFQHFFSALIGITLTQYLYLVGLEYTSATFTSAFLNIVPVNTFILALPFGLEIVNIKNKSGRAKVFGGFICMVGAILLTVYKGGPITLLHSQSDVTPITGNLTATTSNHDARRWVIGSVLLVIASVAWSAWFLIQAVISKRYPCQYSSTTMLMFFSAIQSAIIASVTKRNDTVWVLKGNLEIITIIYSGVVGSALCYVVMSWCVKQRGPVFTAAFTPFTQIFTAMFDFSVLHAQIHVGSVVGSILVIIGLYILLWGKSKEAKENATKQPLVAETKEITAKSPHVAAEEEGRGVESQVPEDMKAPSK